jgi:ankyrin repeat protein
MLIFVALILLLFIPPALSAVDSLSSPPFSKDDAVHLPPTADPPHRPRHKSSLLPRDRLSEAVHIHDVSMVQRLLHSHYEGVISSTPPVDLRRRDEIGRTPLHLCGLDAQTKSKPTVDVDCARIVSMLKEVGYEIDARCSGGWRPLDTYAALGMPETVNVLLEGGAEVDGRDGGHGRTALMLAAINGNFVVAQLMVEKGADVNIRAEGGTMEALGYAVRNEVMRMINVGKGGGGGGQEGGEDDGEIDLMELLEREVGEGGGVGDEQCGADREKNDKDTTVDLGCEPGKEYMRIAALLLEEGADVNVQDKNGRTPLMVAAMAGHKELVRMMVGTGRADLGIVDKDGFGSITYAKTQEIREIIVEIM